MDRDGGALPAPGHVLVRTAAAGLNFIETYQRSGVYTMDLPFTPGTEGSGEVVALGEGVDAALLGARVATATATGAYAEHFTAPRIVSSPSRRASTWPRPPPFRCRA